MARTDTLGHFLTDVADAIREKKGSVDTIAAEDFDTEIENLPSGGGKYAPRAISFYGYTGSELNYELENLDMSNLTSIAYLFSNTRIISFDSNDYDFDTSNVSDAHNMFYNNGYITTADLSAMDLSNVTNTSQMFYSCSHLTSFSLPTNFASALTAGTKVMIANMFQSCKALTSLDLSFLRSDLLYDARNVWAGCNNLETLILPQRYDISNSDYYSLTSMFNGMTKLTNVDLSRIIVYNPNTPSGGNMRPNINSMFQNCSSMTRIDMSGLHFKVEPVICESFYNTFSGCTNLEFLDLRIFDLPNSAQNQMQGMFGFNNNTYVPADCEIIVRDDAGKTWMNTNHPRFTNVKTVAEYEAEQSE